MKDFSTIMGKKISVLCVVLSFLAVNLHAQEVKTVTMSKYISNCLYNFSRYINWPTDKKSGDFIITIVGSKDVYAEMTKLTQNMKVGQQSILVKYAANPAELSGFQHIVFVNDWQSNKFSLVMQKISGTGTLVVTETEGMIGKGSMINFIPVNGMMQFEMSNENLKKNNLMTSSVLEKMATSSN
jgi:hypothetical protein